MRTKPFLSLLSKRILGLFLSLIGIASIMPTVLAQSRPTPAPSTCSPVTLKGSYGFSGAYYPPGGIDGGVGILTFDGSGNVTGSDTVASSTTTSITQRTISGTYSVNPNCTGTFTWTISSPPSPDINAVFSIVIVNVGQKIHFVQTSPAIGEVTVVVAEKI